MNDNRQRTKPGRTDLWQPVDKRNDGSHDAGSRKGESRMEQMVQDCITSCEKCRAACIRAITHSLEVGAEHARQEHIRLLLDCADVCQVSANFLLRGSPSAGYFCSIGGRLCDRYVREYKGLCGLEECVAACETAAALCHRMGRVPSEGI